MGGIAELDDHERVGVIVEAATEAEQAAPAKKPWDTFRRSL